LQAIFFYWRWQALSAVVQTGFLAAALAAALDVFNAVSLPGFVAKRPGHGYTYRSRPFPKRATNRMCEAGKIGKGKKVGNPK